MAEDQHIERDDHRVLMVSLQDPWFSNIAYYLTYGECPDGLTAKQKRDLKNKALKYVILDDVLVGILVKYVLSLMSHKCLIKMHAFYVTSLLPSCMFAYLLQTVCTELSRSAKKVSSDYRALLFYIRR